MVKFFRKELKKLISFFLRPKVRKRTLTVIVTLSTAILALVFFIPFVWMIISSFTPSEEIFSQGFSLFIDNPTLNSYKQLFDAPYLRWYLSSIIFAAGYIIGGLFMTSTAGYAFAKYDFKFRRILLLIVLAAYGVPIHMLLVPLFLGLTKTGLINTYLGLILPMIAHPLGLLFMRQYMEESIPAALLDAARIDGANEFQIFYRVVLPLSAPALSAMAIIFGLFAWNALIWPLVVMRSQEFFTITVGLSTLIGGDSPKYGVLMAGATLSIVPIVGLFLKFEDKFIAGFTGGIKG